MNVNHEFQPCAPPSDALASADPSAQRSDRGGRVRGALLTGGALAVLWAGLHADDPASWIIGGPTVVLGAAASLLLPPAALPRISILGALRFAGFAMTGILRGALDVGWRSLNPATLKPGTLIWHTALPEGGARRLFALMITLLPGTLTARLDGETLVIHALDRSAATRAEIGALEARVAGLFHLSIQQERT
jgi:multicomponent Na+:H+ antiporter subunit E